MVNIRIVVADDEALVRHALRAFLTSAADLQIVGEARNGAEAVDRCCDLAPDIVLMDLQMPVVDGIEAIATISERWPTIKTLAVTTFASERKVIFALRAGASGYLVKDSTPQQIVHAVRDVHNGKAVLSPQISKELIRSVRSGQAGQVGLTADQALTDRELSIVQLLAKGMSNAEIAQTLFLAEPTVKANLRRITAKWQVRDRVQLLIKGVQMGIIEFEEAPHRALP